MTKKEIEILKRRIELKKQLIKLTTNEIEDIEKLINNDKKRS